MSLTCVIGIVFNVESRNLSVHDTAGEESSMHRMQSRIVKLEQELKDARNENSRLHVLVKKLKKEAEEGNQAKKTLENVLARFSPGQQRMLKNPDLQFTNWSDDDIMHALPLFNINQAAYSYARSNMIPLPSRALMNNHLSKLPLLPDQPIQTVFSILDVNFKEKHPFSLETQCVLALDEMAIDPRFCYDKGLDQVFGANKNVTVFCARGLFSNWKQPLLFSFDSSKTLLHLRNLILLLSETGLNVVAVTSDMGPKNQSMWKQLGIGKVKNGVIESTSFENAVTKNRIYWTPDFPHLLKRLRDQVLDNRITFPDGTVLDRSWFEELVKLQEKQELKLTHKLGFKHLYMKGQQRQNSSSAYQMFSHTAAAAVRVLLKHRPGHETVAAFLEMVNDFSDLCGSRIAEDNANKYLTPYGMHLDEQSALLDRVNVRLEAFA